MFLKIINENIINFWNFKCGFFFSICCKVQNRLILLRLPAAQGPFPRGQSQIAAQMYLKLLLMEEGNETKFISVVARWTSSSKSNFKY